MLVDTRKKESNEGFDPFTSNKEQLATCSKSQKTIFVFLCIFTIGLFTIYLITKKN
jgi:hypothetical protein